MNADDVKPKTDSPYTPPSDPSVYIRTYAKDVAALKNSPVPKPTSAPVKVQVPGSQTTEDGVTVKEYDASPVNRAGDPSSPKEFTSEVVALSQSDSDDIFSSPKAPAQAAPISMMPQGSVSVTPNVTPTSTTNEAPKETAEQKEAILARLRAKLASHTPAPTAPPTPEPIPAAPPTPPVPVVEAPAPLPVFEPAPIAKIPEPVRVEPPQFVRPIEPPVAPLPVREATVPVAPAPTVVQPVPLPNTVAASPSPIHTFSSDFSDRIDSQGASTFSVIAAQSDAKPLAAAPKKSRHLLPILAGIVLLLCGVGGVTVAYVYTKNASTVPMVAGVPSLVTFDESVEVQGTGAKLMQAVSDVAGQPSVVGNVIVTYITAPGATGGAIPQPGGALIEALGLDAPTILTRNIDESSTVGTIYAGTESRPFLVLRVNSYERTFAGMLAWEPDMAQSLATFYPAYTDTRTVSVATTSSSTPALLTTTTASVAASPYFSDAVVANHDVRILRDAKGRSILLYGYQGKDTLIIARDEAAFTALIARITATPAQ